MRLARFFVLVALGLAFSGMALADTTDPAIGIKGGGGSTGIFSATNDPNFNFTVNGGEVGVGGEIDFDFINATGQTATEVDLLTTLLAGTPALTYTCVGASQYFNMCSVTDEGNGQTLIRYFDPNTSELGFGGIPNDPNPNCDGPTSCSPSQGNSAADFAIFVQDVNGDLANLPSSEGFSAVGSFVAPVPEPGTIVLLTSGLGAMGLRRLRRNKTVAA